MTQGTFAGRTRREHPGLAAPMFAVLPVMRQLHEMLFSLSEAATYARAASLYAEIEAARRGTERAADGTAEELAGMDVPRPLVEMGDLVDRVGELVRSGTRAGSPGGDLMGRDLRRARIGNAGLRGAYLIGADLRGVDLGTADLLGAHLRAADVRGTDLGRCLFLTQPQVEAARGDGTTILPAALNCPARWMAR